MRGFGALQILKTWSEKAVLRRQWAQQRQRPRGGNVLEMIKGQGENGEEKRKRTDVPQGPRKQEGFVATVGMLALTE